MLPLAAVLWAVGTRMVAVRHTWSLRARGEGALGSDRTLTTRHRPAVPCPALPCPAAPPFRCRPTIPARCPTPHAHLPTLVPHPPRPARAGVVVAGLSFALLAAATAAYHVWDAGDVLGCGIFWCVGDPVDDAEIATGATPKCGAVVAFGVVGFLGCLAGAAASLMLAMSLLIRSNHPELHLRGGSRQAMESVDTSKHGDDDMNSSSDWSFPGSFPGITTNTAGPSDSGGADVANDDGGGGSGHPFLTPAVSLNAYNAAWSPPPGPTNTIRSHAQLRRERMAAAAALCLGVLPMLLLASCELPNTWEEFSAAEISDYVTRILTDTEGKKPEVDGAWMVTVEWTPNPNGVGPVSFKLFPVSARTCRRTASPQRPTISDPPSLASSPPPTAN